jgi:hypothetical protein
MGKGFPTALLRVHPEDVYSATVVAAQAAKSPSIVHLPVDLVCSYTSK